MTRGPRRALGSRCVREGVGPGRGRERVDDGREGPIARDRSLVARRVYAPALRVRVPLTTRALHAACADGPSRLGGAWASDHK
jgi:hypothetical protein